MLVSVVHLFNIEFTQSVNVFIGPIGLVIPLLKKEKGHHISNEITNKKTEDIKI